jgi:glucosamine-6-phosphate deaminase
MREHLPSIDILSNRDAVASRAAGVIIDGVASKHVRTLGLATGGTMVQLYGRLVAAFRSGNVSFENVTTFNLDDYVGVPSAAPGSFRAFMRRYFIDLVDIDPTRAHMPDGMAGDVATEAVRYETLIRQTGGIDMQLLGIGRNGHIGFNEPGSDFGSRTREVCLTDETRAANAAFFVQDAGVPQRAVTMGIGTILEAKEILLVAMGAHKAEAIGAAISGPISIMCPASALRRHPRVHIICDEAAASQIEGRVTSLVRRLS